MVEKLLQRLVAENQRRQPSPMWGSGRACGVGETAPIIPLGAADFGTTVSAETRLAGLE